MDTEGIIAAHRRAGRDLVVDGVRTFALDRGAGPAVVCLHGVPVSSYVYRKVVAELAARGLRAIAPDLPGLGFAERPGDLDYTWTGLGRWTARAIEALVDGPVHLVVHDIGGPVGFEAITHLGAAVRSVTLLNTITDVGSFTPPPVMRPFTWPLLDRAWLGGQTDWLFVRLMRAQGVADRSAATDAELAAHRHLLMRDDGGRAFLRIMRSYETTAAKSRQHLEAIRGVPHRQVIWGDRDPALAWSPFGETAVAVADVGSATRLPAKHFLQEDQAPAIADRVADLVARAG